MRVSVFVALPILPCIQISRSLEISAPERSLRGRARARVRTNPRINPDPNLNATRSSLGSMAHEELPVPIYSSLEPVYGEGSPLEEAQLRFQTLKAKFVELFAQEPEAYARSPGKILDPPIRFLWNCF